MTENPVVSIIIPSFNRASLIIETLNSVLEQTYSHWECIIVDDGSQDETVAILQEFCLKDLRFQNYNRPLGKPKGANVCRNYGFVQSRGQYILFLDSDDVLEKNCLIERVEIMSKIRTIDILIRDSGRLIDTKKEYTSINIDPEEINSENYLRMFLRYDVPWQTTSAFYKRKLLEKCKFDEELSRFQDVSINVKILSTFEDIHLLRSVKIDSFYRVENEKIISRELFLKLINSLINFNEIHFHLAKNESYKKDLRLFNVKFLHGYFMKDFEEYSQEIKCLIFSYLKGNIFSCKQKIYLVSSLLFYRTGLIHQQRIGMNRFIKSYNKIFNFDRLLDSK
jgi:glycosyltransferase involved in cell wall biosynthesis